MSEEMQNDLNRRSFLAAAAALGCGCALCGHSAMAADDDDDDGEPAPKIKAGPVDVGVAADYAKDGGYGKFINKAQVIVVREKGKLFAISAVCTHKRNMLKLVDDYVYCPAHRSRFNVEGAPIPKLNGKPGQAKEPLAHYSIVKNSAGRLIVDTSKVLPAGDPGAEVAV